MIECIFILADFGNEDVGALVDHFTDKLQFNSIDCASIHAEWISLKNVLYTK